jgi:hypothetical protein
MSRRFFLQAKQQNAEKGKSAVKQRSFPLSKAGSRVRAATRVFAASAIIRIVAPIIRAWLNQDSELITIIEFDNQQFLVFLFHSTPLSAVDGCFPNGNLKGHETPALAR